MAVYTVGDVYRLRPHVKTFKSREAALLEMDAGVTKFKCATIAEAEMLGMCNAPDVLFAYQPYGPKLTRFIRLTEAYPGTKFSCLIDNELSANEISESAKAGNIIVDVYIDLNIGMDRTGVRPEDALPIYRYAQNLPGINVMGLHAYDGHIRDVAINVRTARCNEAYERVVKLKEGIVANGYPDPVIIAGGSPTFPVHAKRQGVECSPGTFIYWDRGYALTCPEQDFLIAALVVARVVSIISATRFCVDLGHKSVAAENLLDKRVYFINAPELKMISQSEEHLVVEASEGHGYQVGDVLYGSPYHICPTVALYERAVTVEHNNITREWLNIARDRKIVLKKVDRLIIVFL